MARRIAVILSQGQSANPAKRRLEEDLVTALMDVPGADVMVVPHLYDLAPQGTGMLALSGIAGDMIVLAWLFPRAAHWTLDRHGIRGIAGPSLLDEDEDEDEEGEGEGEEPGEEADDEAKVRVVDEQPRPGRTIWCLDLRKHAEIRPYVDEVRRIIQEQSQQVVALDGWLGGAPSADQQARYERPTNDTALPIAGAAGGNGAVAARPPAAPIQRIEEQPGRRWYPVIDFSRCTNCMECIDFCLFGVYGVDTRETILVEQPDNCRKGCPACSRVCPENAIIFPQHKTPAIAGAADGLATLKIDLSQLFGAPASSESALDVAVRERDEQLMAAGRDAVGASVGLPKRQADKPQGPKDELDELIDGLDEF